MSLVLPVAAGRDRSLAAKQQHVMDCFHTGMRCEVHCGAKALWLSYLMFNDMLESLKILKAFRLNYLRPFLSKRDLQSKLIQKHNFS